MAAKVIFGTSAIAQGLTSLQLMIDAYEHDVRTQPTFWGWDGRPVTRGEEEDTDTIFFPGSWPGAWAMRHFECQLRSRQSVSRWVDLAARFFSRWVVHF